MPEAVDIILEVSRKRPNQPMSFRISVKACFEEETPTTPVTSSVPTTSSPYSTLTASSIETTSGVFTTSIPSTVTTQGTEASSVHVTPTTVCTVDEGMDDPKNIPDSNIIDETGKTPADVGRLRPTSRTPFSVNKRTYTIRFLFRPAIPVERLEVIKPDNVDSITVKYVSPSRPNNPVDVVTVSSLYDSELYRFLEVLAQRWMTNIYLTK
jgi:hypothetical protein